MNIRSMTAFATASGQSGSSTWAWDIRGVNGAAGPAAAPARRDRRLEAAVRKSLSDVLERGSITIGLRLTRAEGEGGLVLDPAQLDRVIDALIQIEQRASDKGLHFAPATAPGILGQKGVLVPDTGTEDADALHADVMSGLKQALGAFVQMREAEGTALTKVILGQLDQIATLTEAAETAAKARQPELKTKMQTALRAVLDTAPDLDESRLAQELAAIAVKQDVTEELDRLRGHVAAARDLLGQGGAIGRKLDFLAQEFNREANTLCSKAQNGPLTAIGLDLKAVIDQMREQIQNLE